MKYLVECHNALLDLEIEPMSLLSWIQHSKQQNTKLDLLNLTLICLTTLLAQHIVSLVSRPAFRIFVVLDFILQKTIKDNLFGINISYVCVHICTYTYMKVSTECNVKNEHLLILSDIGSSHCTYWLRNSSIVTFLSVILYYSQIIKYEL